VRDLERENRAVLDAVQAVLGRIDESVIGVFVEALAESVTLHIFVTDRTSVTDDDFADVAFEMEALADNPLQSTIKVERVVGPAHRDVFHRWRPVYWAKADEPD
jgi:hypothetical protein